MQKCNTHMAGFKFYKFHFIINILIYRIYRVFIQHAYIYLISGSTQFRLFLDFFLNIKNSNITIHALHIFHYNNIE